MGNELKVEYTATYNTYMYVHVRCVVLLFIVGVMLTNLLFSSGSVYDSMSRLNQQSLSCFKGKAVPHKQHQLEIHHIKIWGKGI